jgi:hypothetical protein
MRLMVWIASFIATLREFRRQLADWKARASDASQNDAATAEESIEHQTSNVEHPTVTVTPVGLFARSVPSVRRIGRAH